MAGGSKRTRAGHVVRAKSSEAATNRPFVSPPIRYPNAKLLQRSYTSKELAVRYGFPAITAKSPFWVAILELGGGWSPKDLELYCRQLGIAVPKTQEITLPGGDGKFTGKPGSADGEYALDMQVIAGATEGQVGLLLVNAPNGGNGMADGLNAIADWTGGTVSCVSLSWGRDEGHWADELIDSTEEALKGLASKNIPVFAASGDDGSSDNALGDNVDYPASSPYSFGCGGTTIALDGMLETAWASGGGGVSKRFKRPEWQVANNIAKLGRGRRCVPDGAMDADPQSGYSIILNGAQQTVGGTSAVAPMFAAWKALTDTVAGAVLPFSAASVYELHDLTDIVIGNNGDFKAMPGYDLCTGEGVPNANFTLAWLAQNQVTASYAPRFDGAAYIPHSCGATPAAPTNGAAASAERHGYQVATA